MRQKFSVEILLNFQTKTGRFSLDWDEKKEKGRTSPKVESDVLTKPTSVFENPFLQRQTWIWHLKVKESHKTEFSDARFSRDHIMKSCCHVVLSFAITPN